MKNLAEHPTTGFIAPFFAFILLLAGKNILPISTKWQYPLQLLIVFAILFKTSRHLLSWKPGQLGGSILVGVVVFVIWVGPDVIWPGYRHQSLFENSLTGKAQSSLPPSLQSDSTFLVFRLIGSAVLVPIIEELFWRGWLMRYLINADFQKVALGTYSAMSYWVTAVLFATEHGPYWEVGLLAGVIYNWWMIRTRNLTDCIVAHGVTNLILGLFVVFGRHWEYWL